jgi:hypothetical protein
LYEAISYSLTANITVVWFASGVGCAPGAGVDAASGVGVLPPHALNKIDNTTNSHNNLVRMFLPLLLGHGCYGLH